MNSALPDNCSHYINVIAIVEGKTEQIFIEKYLSPYLAMKHVFISATQVSKPGQKGGDVKFSRVVRDIGNHLKQQSSTYVCSFVDYYGVKEWPGIEHVPSVASPAKIAEIVNTASQQAVAEQFPELQTATRYIPYLAVHEFEALLFSDERILAEKLGISVTEIETVLAEFGDPESINNSKITAPSKRLARWNSSYKKTSTGIAIAGEIGIDKMREKCHVFNDWLTKLEQRAGHL